MVKSFPNTEIIIINCGPNFLIKKLRKEEEMGQKLTKKRRMKREEGMGGSGEVTGGGVSGMSGETRGVWEQPRTQPTQHPTIQRTEGQSALTGERRI